MAMTPFSKIALVVRTIGAERGRAARGRPADRCWPLADFPL